MFGAKLRFEVRDYGGPGSFGADGNTNLLDIRDL